MTHRGSIARRLAIALTASACMLWLISVIVAAIVLRHELSDSYDDALRQTAYRVLPLAIHELRDGDLRQPSNDVLVIGSIAKAGSDLSYRVIGPQGVVLLTSNPNAEMPAASAVPDGISLQRGNYTFALTDPISRFRIIVGERDGLRQSVLRESILAMLLPLAALIPLLAVLVVVIVRSAMRPIWDLGRAISKRHGRNLEPFRLGPQPRELAPIVAEAEDLLSRLKGALETERSFAAESAHELRTPIAGALAQVQVLASQLHQPEHIKHVKETEKSLRNLAALAENLLQIARLEAGFALASEPTKLLPILNLVLDESAFRQARDRIKLTRAPGAEPCPYITPDALAIALRNLLQNALRYSAPETPVIIEVGADRISIENRCPPVSPDLLKRLTERFVRAHDGTRGTGLGLAIVNTIMRDCGGKLILTSPAPGRPDGFLATLDFAGARA